MYTQLVVVVSMWPPLLVLLRRLSLSLSLSLSKTTYKTNRKERERCVYHTVFEYTNQILQSRFYICRVKKKRVLLGVLVRRLDTQLSSSSSSSSSLEQSAFLTLSEALRVYAERGD